LEWGIWEKGMLLISLSLKKDYAATLVDQTDVSMDLEKFSFEGQTYFIGKLGRAEISIDFDKIDSVLFILQDDQVKARLNLKDGKTLEIIVDKDKNCSNK